jgi:hypothetical protein
MALHSPGITPHQFGFKNGDYHLVANAHSKKIKAFTFEGELLWEVDCLCDGQHPNFREPRGDTPPGLYELGTCYDDYSIYLNNPPYTKDILSYGWIFYDLKDLGSPDGEDINGRSGVALHGGGTGLGFPGCWDGCQPLLYTWGCVRMHNFDIYYKVKPLKTNTNRVFVSVHQDDV